MPAEVAFSDLCCALDIDNAGLVMAEVPDEVRVAAVAEEGDPVVADQTVRVGPRRASIRGEICREGGGANAFDVSRIKSEKSNIVTGNEPSLDKPQPEKKIYYCSYYTREKHQKRGESHLE